MVVRNGINRVRSHGVVEDSIEALSQTKVAVSLRRDDSRIAADRDRHLKAPKDHKVNGNSAFFSAEREGNFSEILKLDSMSQVSNLKKSDAAAHNPNLKS